MKEGRWGEEVPWNLAPVLHLFPVDEPAHEGESVKTRTKATLIAAVLTVDGVIHTYWATGAIWPARTPNSLSRAVLDIDGTFTPQVVLPLAALLWIASGLVIARSRGRGGRLAALATAAVCGGLALRGCAGLVWATGIGTSTGASFYWLNLLAYTPICLVLAPLAFSVARGTQARPAGERSVEPRISPALR
jgi:Protein of unknown function (DUF3995)